MTTQSKTRSKPASKPAVKPASKPATLAYAAILGDALAGKFGDVIKRFYLNAIKYHDKQKTTFPRGRIADVALMSPDDTRAFIAAREVTSIPAGSLAAQRAFDQMMIELQQQERKV